MRLRRGGDAAWALLLLGLGHLALGNRLGWSLFDLFCLDAWLLPAWFTLRERDSDELDRRRDQNGRSGDHQDSNQYRAMFASRLPQSDRTMR